MVAHLERGCVSLGVGGGTPLDLSRACMYFIGHARGFSTGHVRLLHWHSKLPDGVCTLSKWLEKAACGRTPDVRRGIPDCFSPLFPEGIPEHCAKRKFRLKIRSTHMTYVEMCKVMRTLTTQLSYFLTGLFSLKNLRVIYMYNFHNKIIQIMCGWTRSK